MMNQPCATDCSEEFNEFALTVMNALELNLPNTVNEALDVYVTLIEGFGGKRALGFFLKIELCRKRSKFRMQFCLGVLNNVLYVFLLKFSSFPRYYVCKKACICGLIST